MAEGYKALGGALGTQGRLQEALKATSKAVELKPSYTSAVTNFDSQIGRTTPVGLYADGVSPYGCHDMSGNVNNWTSDWYWPAFGRFCVQRSLLRDPHLHDRLRLHLGGSLLSEKVDRGGGFGTARECQEVLSCTRKVHWKPETREPWNGFRTAADDGMITGGR